MVEELNNSVSSGINQMLSGSRGQGENVGGSMVCQHFIGSMCCSVT